MSITFGELLQYDILKELVVLGGMRGIDQQAANVSTLENPEMVKWMKPGEILLTTGYLFREDTALGVKLLRDLSKLGCNALGIKVKRYLEEIPKELIEESDRLNFPLFEIPFYLTLSDVGKSIMKRILSDKINLLEESEQILNQLLDIILSGGSIQDILDFGGNFWKNLLLFTDSDDNLQYYSNSAAALGNKLLGNPVPFARDEGKGVLIDDTVYELHTYPINANATLLGQLHILCERERRDGFSNPLVIEHFVRMITIQILNEKESANKMMAEKNNFLCKLLEGGFVSLKELLVKGVAYGLHDNGKYVCIVIRPGTSDMNVHDESALHTVISLEERQKRLLTEIKGLIRNRNHFITKGQDIVGILEFSENTPDETAEEETASIGISICRMAKKIDSFCTCKVGIGTVADTLSEICFGYSEAVQAVEILRDVSGVTKYREHIVELLLKQNPRQGRMLCKFLDPLIKYDKLNGDRLLNTLSVVIACKFNLSRAARHLFIHRNTLEHRLERIRNLLNSDLDDMNELLILQLGLIALEHGR
ncbi:MAG: PucR family transcriptional regulator ligand-binding domain-containing protein [Clostridiales Family XIII bacterium]|jgi:purine catabolism regulator|nr:PucR family transcriptional regulator ligand-binding domain-containing protein [Clostridiales Family XIII bacterium]